MYFNESTIKTLEELKQAYHKLAMRLHPDRGGSVEQMQALNNEYDILFQKVKNTHYSHTRQTVYSCPTDEQPEDFRSLIDELIKIDDIKIEIIGCFLWVSGKTRPQKEQLKRLGLRWSRDKQKWYKSPAGYRRFGKRDYTYEEIQSMYGVQASYRGHGPQKLNHPHQ